MFGFIWHIIKFFIIPVTFAFLFFFFFFSLHFPTQALTLLLQAAQIFSKNVTDDPIYLRSATLGLRDFWGHVQWRMAAGMCTEGDLFQDWKVWAGFRVTTCSQPGYSQQTASLGSLSEVETLWPTQTHCIRNWLLSNPQSMPSTWEFVKCCSRPWSGSRKPLYLQVCLYLQWRPGVGMNREEALKTRKVTDITNLYSEEQMYLPSAMPYKRSLKHTQPSAALSCNRFNWIPIIPPSIEFTVSEVWTFHILSISQSFHPKNPLHKGDRMHFSEFSGATARSGYCKLNTSLKLLL